MQKSLKNISLKNEYLESERAFARENTAPCASATITNVVVML
jgi:hypothetical protein